MVNLFIMNLIVGATALLIVRYFLFFERLSDYLIAFFLIFLAQIILTLQILGIMNLLYSNYILMLNLSILLIVYAAIRLLKIGPKNIFFLKYRQAVNSLRLGKIGIFAISVILGFALVKFFINLVNPPFGWDCLNYHFTFPVEWLKHGNLENPIVVSCDPAPPYYPINGSLFFLWLILPLRNVFIADLGQAPFFIMGFLIVYALARRLKLSKEYALFSASLFTLVPNYFKQLQVAYVDVMVSTLLLAALYYLFLLEKEKNLLKNAVLFSLSLGLMLGTKTTGLVYAFLLYLPFFYFILRKSKNFLFLVLISLSIVVVMGGFSYIRNFIQTGNPLYPLTLTVFNKTIFKGVIDNVVYRAHTSSWDYNLIKILFSEGLGAQTVIFIVPAVLLGLPLTIMKKKKDLNFIFIYFLILPILLILAFRFIIPLANLRYLYALLAIGLLIAFCLADILNIPKNLIRVLVAVCLVASLGEIAKHKELIASLLFSIALFFTFPYLFNLLKLKKLNKALIFIAILLILPFIALEKNYVKNEYARYIKMTGYSGFWPDATLAWDWLNQNTDRNNIAYVGRPVPFPLYGTNFKNNVYYVSVNRVEPAKPHYFKDSKYIWGYDGESLHKAFEEDKNYRGQANYDTWLNNLKNRHTDYLFIYSLHQIKTVKFPKEDAWAAGHPEKFNLVYKNNTVHIYKIIK
ncbi:MAG: hypothetical protein FJZ11_00310 [Candidatus Omnitrophica bacterium]|nr:hypothetical protein [Candidatus Omnitrophota bacterium]